MIKGRTTVGTGFLIRPGVIATNAHVIAGEFVSDLEVRFPSAPKDQQGPMPVELLYEDSKRDLAFLAVSSKLPALDIASTYPFVRGEDVTLIGNPGAGDQVVLENAVTKGLMSSQTVIEGMNFLQLSIALNPGNSGGPVFDSTGRVVAVATLKSTRAEGLAFSIPIDDVQTALGNLAAQSSAARQELVSRRCADLAFGLLATAGALYSVGLDVRTAVMQIPAQQRLEQRKLLSALEERRFTPASSQVTRLQTDSALVEDTRLALQELRVNYEAMRDLYLDPAGPKAKIGVSVHDPQWLNLFKARVVNLRANHLRLVKTLAGRLKSTLAPPLMAVLESRPVARPPQEVFAEILPPRFFVEQPAPEGDGPSDRGSGATPKQPPGGATAHAREPGRPRPADHRRQLCPEESIL